MHVESFPKSVENGGAHAVVEREPANEEPSHAVSAQSPGQVGFVEIGVVVAIEIVALGDDRCVGGQLEPRMKRRAHTMLYAVRGPRAASLSEAHVAARMPTARSVDGNARRHRR